MNWLIDDDLSHRLYQMREEASMTTQHNEASVSGQTLTSQGLSHASPACRQTKKGAAGQPPPTESGRYL